MGRFDCTCNYDSSARSKERKHINDVLLVNSLFYRMTLKYFIYCESITKTIKVCSIEVLTVRVIDSQFCCIRLLLKTMKRMEHYMFLNPVLRCPLRLPCKNYVQLVFSSSSFVLGSCFSYVICT